MENAQAVREKTVARRVGGSSAVDAAAGRILDLIRARQLNVGDVLPTERELSEITGASRNTVREALRTIRTYGLIEPKPRVGAVLADGQSIARFYPDRAAVANRKRSWKKRAMCGRRPYNMQRHAGPPPLGVTRGPLAVIRS